MCVPSSQRKKLRKSKFTTTRANRFSLRNLPWHEVEHETYKRYIVQAPIPNRYRSEIGVSASATTWTATWPRNLQQNIIPINYRCARFGSFIIYYLLRISNIPWNTMPASADGNPFLLASTCDSIRLRHYSQTVTREPGEICLRAINAPSQLATGSKSHFSDLRQNWSNFIKLLLLLLLRLSIDRQIPLHNSKWTDKLATARLHQLGGEFSSFDRSMDFRMHLKYEKPIFRTSKRVCSLCDNGEGLIPHHKTFSHQSRTQENTLNSNQFYYWNSEDGKLKIPCASTSSKYSGIILPGIRSMTSMVTPDSVNEIIRTNETFEYTDATTVSIILSSLNGNSFEYKKLYLFLTFIVFASKYWSYDYPVIGRIRIRRIPMPIPFALKHTDTAAHDDKKIFQWKCS